MTEKARERLSDQLLEARVRRATLLNRQRDAFEAHRARERRRRTAKSAAKQWVRRKTESISLAGKAAGGPTPSAVPAAAGRSSAPPAVVGRGFGAGGGDGDGSDGDDDDDDIGQSFVRHVSRISSATAASIGGLGESVSAFGSFAFGDAFATEVRCCLCAAPGLALRRAAARRSRDPPERSAHGTLPTCPPALHPSMCLPSPPQYMVVFGEPQNKARMQRGQAQVRYEVSLHAPAAPSTAARRRTAAR